MSILYAGNDKILKRINIISSRITVSETLFMGDEGNKKHINRLPVLLLINYHDCNGTFTFVYTTSHG